MDQAILRLGETETPVEDVCRPGADPTFDQLLSALGHISRQKPRPLIETIMLWRSRKGDAVKAAKEQATHRVCQRNERIGIMYDSIYLTPFFFSLPLPGKV